MLSLKKRKINLKECTHLKCFLYVSNINSILDFYKKNSKFKGDITLGNLDYTM